MSLAFKLVHVLHLRVFSSGAPQPSAWPSTTRLCPDSHDAEDEDEDERVSLSRVNFTGLSRSSERTNRWNQGELNNLERL